VTGAQAWCAVDGAVLRALESEFAVLVDSGARYGVLIARPCDPQTRRRPGGDEVLRIAAAFLPPTYPRRIGMRT